MYKTVQSLGAALTATVLLFVAIPSAYGNTFELYTVEGFVEMLIERGIVPESMAEKARSIVTVVETIEGSDTKNRAPYREHVDVRVSQLIEHSQRMYQSGSDIEGLLLLATNMSEEDIYPQAVRRCQVVYRIYEDETLLYDSATKRGCDTDERVHYRIAPRQTRLFEVEHKATDFALSKGTYTFVIEYPGYGSGNLGVTVF